MNPGDMCAGFEVVSVRDLEEYQAKGILLKHRSSGCEVYHVCNNDEENLFSFGFRTVPSDNSGVAHILEHSVLCGSLRFPVKDPFLVLMKGSMNTFLNAMTFPDKTVYPASSTVTKDYFNIMDVYGDAVFFPLLRKEVFLQEGYRYEAAEDGTLSPVGVVFNEMKGNYSNPDSIASEWSYRSLFPDSPYKWDAGGEPKSILTLTHEKLVNYHRTFYHPSNCKIFLYGNIPTEEQLEFLHARFLSKFSSLSLQSWPLEQKRWLNPGRLEKTYPVDGKDDPTKKASVFMSWLTVPVSNTKETLSMEILSEALIGNSGSPLRKALVESGLGEDLSPVSGIESDLREQVFCVGLRGTDVGKADDIENLIFQELSRLRDEGIEKEVLEGTIRRFEFRNREVRGGGGPYGLRLMRKAYRTWMHGFLPEEGLKFASIMLEIKKRAEADARYFENLIDTQLIRNQHRIRIVLKPDANHAEREKRELEAFVRAKQESLLPQSIAELRADNESLVHFQEKEDGPEDTRKIPHLSIGDLPRRVAVIPTEIETTADGLSVFKHGIFSNGIAYVDIAFDLKGIDPVHFKILPFLGRCITRGGLPGLPYYEVARKLALYTGGFSPTLDIGGMALKSGESAEHMVFRLKALESILPEALSLAVELLLETDFSDKAHIKDLLLEMRNDYTSSILPRGHAYAALRAGSRIATSLFREEEWEGIAQLLYLNELCAGNNIEEIIPLLSAASKAVFTHGRLKLNITCNPESLEKTKQIVLEHVGSFPHEPPAEGNVSSVIDRAAPKYETILIPASVGYNATAFPGFRLGTPENAAETVLAHILRTGYLWEHIRMKNGAYGAFASASGTEGVFSFASYRDPEVVETLRIFVSSLEFLANGNLAEETVSQAIIGCVGQEVRPYAPGQEGFIGFKRIVYGITDEMRQARRETMLALSSKNIAETAERLREFSSQACSVVMTGKERYEQAVKDIPSLAEHKLEITL